VAIGAAQLDRGGDVHRRRIGLHVARQAAGGLGIDLGVALPRRGGGRANQRVIARHRLFAFAGQVGAARSTSAGHRRAISTRKRRIGRINSSRSHWRGPNSSSGASLFVEKVAEALAGQQRPRRKAAPRCSASPWAARSRRRTDPSRSALGIEPSLRSTCSVVVFSNHKWLALPETRNCGRQVEIRARAGQHRAGVVEVRLALFLGRAQRIEDAVAPVDPKSRGRRRQRGSSGESSSWYRPRRRSGSRTPRRTRFRLLS
jgi:hypothetical protein